MTKRKRKRHTPRSVGQRARQFETLEERRLLTGFTAFNALYTGISAHPNTTRFADAPGSVASGQLVDIESGELLEAEVSVSAIGVQFGGQGTSPHPDSDAGQIFAGFVDFSGGDRRTVEINSTDVYQYTFGNLDVGALYDFAGTAVRGNPAYTNRWTLVEIEGAESFDESHSSGEGIRTAGLKDNQVAVWTGHQTEVDQGYVAQWINIDPGPDGEFTISSKQYTGRIPSSVDAGRLADGNKGYGLSAFRFVEQTPLGPPQVENTLATEVWATSAILSGKVTNTGGQLPDVTLYYGTADGGTNPAAWQHSVPAPPGKTYSQVVDGLQMNTAYFYRSFGENSLGSDWANASTSFTTLLASAPSVTTLAATNVGGVTATLAGRVDSTGNDPPLVTLYYGTKDGGTDTAAWDQSVDLGLQTGAFGSIIDRLSELTGYFFNVRAQNSMGWAWGATEQFATSQVPPLVINEFMADNAQTLMTRVRAQSGQPFVGDPRTPDWIELRNTMATPADLTGYFLTDDLGARNKWQFPDGTMIPASGLFMVFASGFNILDPSLDENGFLHTSFQLSTLAGSDLALIAPDNSTAFAIEDAPGQVEDVSFGRSAEGNLRFFAVPTPNRANSSATPPAPIIRLESKTFTERVTVEIVPASPSHTIHYTTDEQVPTTSSQVYTGPLELTKTTNLRAISVVANGESSVVVGASYIKIPTFVANDETHLPILIVDTFGDSISRSRFGDDFVAIIEPGADGIASPSDPFDLTTRAGIRIRGSSSAGFSKKQYRVEFRDEQGEDRKLKVLGMPQEADWIFYGPSQYDRNLISNPLMYDLSNQIGRYATRTKWVEAYFNGRYFGVYAIMEVIERDDDRVDVEPLSTGAGGQPVEGGFIWKNDRGSAYVDPENLTSAQRRHIDGYMDDFTNAAEGANFKDPDDGYAAFIEVDTFIDHNMLNLLAMNVDALRLSSYYYKTADGKLQAGPIWDFDRSLDSTDGRDNNPRAWFGTGDSTRYFNDSSRVRTWWPAMFKDPDFVQQYIDRWFELRQTTFSNANLFATIDKHAADLGEAADRDYAKWSRSRFGNFQGEMDHLKDWLGKRVEWIDSKWMPAPESDAAGDRVPVGTSVTITGGTGSVYYMLDGTDPRGDQGQIRPEALQATEAIPIAADTHLIARRYRSGFGGNNGYIRTGDDWSAPLSITPLRVPADVRSLAITEIHFNPAAADVIGGEKNADNDEFEFLEVTNISSVPVELEGIKLIETNVDGDNQGVKFTFEAQVLQPGESVVVVESVEAFQSRYGEEVRIAAGQDDPGDTPGQYAGKLSNGGERLTLVDAEGTLIRQIDYDDWYASTDGGGPSLVVVNANVTDPAQLSRQSAWTPSARVHGDPGVAEVGPGADFDGSGFVDISDIDLLYAAMQQAAPEARFDLTEDGDVNHADLTLLVEGILQTRRGDANLDGKVDFGDFLVVSANFGRTERSWATGDFDANKATEFSDFLALSSHFGFDRDDD